MRMIDTFNSNNFKITIFQTEARYLLQAEDERYMLSWKLDREIPYDIIKEKAAQMLATEATDIWPSLLKNLQLDFGRSAGENEFPNII